MTIDLNWLNEQLDEYAALHPQYKAFAELLEKILKKGVRKLAPQALVQARPKSLRSFAEKIVRKQKYDRPLEQLTDLCGARVITHTQAEVERVCDFVRRVFDIDEANSLDSATRLRESEFGYRSVHYIILPRRSKLQAVFPKLDIPNKMLGFKAEIQIRTIAQHCWADIGHDRIYKPSATDRVPKRWKREFHRVAALLESVDEAFGRAVEAVDAYRSSYEPYHVDSEMPRELAVAYETARLAASRQEWAVVQSLLEKFLPEARDAAPVLLCFGTALCQLHKSNRRGAGYRKGLEHLEQAITLAPDHVEALATLGESLVGVDDDRALQRFEQALEIAASDPKAVSGYAIMRVNQQHNLAFVHRLRGNLESAIRKCQNQAEVGVNLPGAFYNIGAFHLLLNRPQESLAAYAKAIHLSADKLPIASALDFVDQLVMLKDSPKETEWVRRLLLLGKSAKFPGDNPDARLRVSPKLQPLAGPVVIVAGGCDRAVQQRIAEYRQLLIGAFRDFRGTIISGGTTAGISGLVGELGDIYKDQFRIVGYLPHMVPSWVKKDGRYTEVYETDGTGFSQLEPLQNWIDLLDSGIAPSQVRLLGINGGEIAAFEYRLALALGAEVGILRDSGREAGRLLTDPEWEGTKGLGSLPTELMTVKNFIDRSYQSRLAADVRELLARQFHERYRASRKGTAPKDDPAIAEWPELDEKLKESNRQLADHIDAKLLAVGRKAYPVKSRKIVPKPFSSKEIELLAEMEHGRWNVERLLDGWSLGARDSAEKKSPYLVSWEELPGVVREWDRETVRNIPAMLAEIGLEIGPV